MLNQNYLKVFQNQGGTITIASAEPVSDDIHDMTFKEAKNYAQLAGLTIQDLMRIRYLEE